MTRENIITSALSSLQGLDNTKIRILPKIEKIRSDLIIELEKHPLLGDVDYVRKVENLLIMFDTLIDLSEEQIRLLKQALESLNTIHNVEEYAKPNTFYSTPDPIRDHLHKLAEQSMNKSENFGSDFSSDEKVVDYTPPSQGRRMGRPPSNKRIPIKTPKIEREDIVEDIADDTEDR